MKILLSNCICIYFNVCFQYYNKNVGLFPTKYFASCFHLSENRHFYACADNKICLNLIFSNAELCRCAIIYLLSPLLIGIYIIQCIFITNNVVAVTHLKNPSLYIMEVFLHDIYISINIMCEITIILISPKSSNL